MRSACQMRTPRCFMTPRRLRPAAAHCLRMRPAGGQWFWVPPRDLRVNVTDLNAEGPAGGIRLTYKASWASGRCIVLWTAPAHWPAALSRRGPPPTRVQAAVVHSLFAWDDSDEFDVGLVAVEPVLGVPTVRLAPRFMVRAWADGRSGGLQRALKRQPSGTAMCKP